ncbi:glia maturation factor beta [Tilletiopsis washingtonensis]|uniref:Glia maturation factor beta n=1 Tax=Tilletiopsis washingtonensis TaxID=58919 RepID=A0A316Z1Y6_9BASI|nr:glia maturation factor beta [Tilletiopsis washingtonensis]PWN95797.1 glia maturation factor beta [Tilletiopsis washingtonensis]
MSMKTVDIPTNLLERLKAFRMGKRSVGAAALVVKIDKKTLRMEIEEEFEGIALDELQEELPENSPRFVVMSYELEHRDGRKSYPLVIIYWAPPTSSMELATLYASAMSHFSTASDIAKVLDVREGVLEKKSIDARLGA